MPNIHLYPAFSCGALQIGEVHVERPYATKQVADSSGGKCSGGLCFNYAAMLLTRLSAEFEKKGK